MIVHHHSPSHPHRIPDSILPAPFLHSPPACSARRRLSLAYSLRRSFTSGYDVPSTLSFFHVPLVRTGPSVVPFPFLHTTVAEYQRYSSSAEALLSRNNPIGRRAILSEFLRPVANGQGSGVGCCASRVAFPREVDEEGEQTCHVSSPCRLFFYGRSSPPASVGGSSLHR